MPTARPTLAAAKREITGKKVAHLRRAGRLPGVLFGHGVASENVSVDTHEFEILHRRVGNTTLIDVEVDGHKARPALIYGVQREPLKHRMVHVDLFVVRMTEELTVDVPVTVIGTAAAVELLGGTLSHISTLKVRALPDRLPGHIDVSIDGLADFDAVVHVSDLSIPGDVTLVTDPTEIAARVLPPRVEEVAVVAETAAEGAPTEEGEAAEGTSDGATAPSEG
ncbi:MAG TPA: 50S ribosomal protein L25 [Candidatus Limnocylindrales bacterium]